MIAAVEEIMAGPCITRVLTDGNARFVEIEPLRLFPINRRRKDGSCYVGHKQKVRRT